MKKTFSSISLLTAMLLMFCIATSYGQCNGTKSANIYGHRSPCKTGIALVIADSAGQHITPTAALTLPTFKGGNREMCRYINKNKQYPADLLRQGVSGTATVQATVKADSTITDVKVVHSSGYPQFDDEAVRLVKSFPHMVPATQSCKAMDMTVQFPITFTAEKEKR